MQFAILTTTYKRPTELQRAVDSVRCQSFTGYIHYIVNDSPDFDYKKVEEDIKNDPKIRYIKNSDNLGKNSSLNRVLTILRDNQFSGYIIFLDDDDWLASTCLSDFKNYMDQNKKGQWFVSNRALENGVSLTKNLTGKNTISYFGNYLLFKRFSGDATHCIDSKLALSSHFPTKIKNGEEWYYFLRLKGNKKFLYIDQIGTYTNGYRPDGQNTAMQINYKNNTLKLFREKQTTFSFVYLVLRTLRTPFYK